MPDRLIRGISHRLSGGGSIGRGRAAPWSGRYSPRRPSRSSCTWSANAAACGSCVASRSAVAALAAELAQQAQHLAGALRVEVPGRLVGEHQLRVGRQRERDQHALALAHRELLGAVLQPVAEPQLLQQRFDRVACAPRMLDQQQLQRGVLDRPRPGDQVVRLADDPELAQAVLVASPCGTSWTTSRPSTSTLPLSGAAARRSAPAASSCPSRWGRTARRTRPAAILIDTPSTARIGSPSAHAVVLDEIA